MTGTPPTMLTELPAHQALLVIGTYLTRVANNWSESWDTIAAVADDEECEVRFELHDTAHDLGIQLTDDTDGGTDTWGLLVELWEEGFKEALRNLAATYDPCEWCNGRGCQSCGGTGRRTDPDEEG